MRFYNKPITTLGNWDIFVFGSNLAGIHGAGSARTAYRFFGAKYGIGDGKTGKCYAIPTKDYDIMTLPIEVIGVYVVKFGIFAKENSTFNFYVTKIGCGLAGYKDSEIAPLFAGIDYDNVLYNSDWKNLLV